MVNGGHGHHGVPVLRPVVEALKIGPGSVTALRQTLKEQLALVWLLKNKIVKPRHAPVVSSHQSCGIKGRVNVPKWPAYTANIVSFFSIQY